MALAAAFESSKRRSCRNCSSFLLLFHAVAADDGEEDEHDDVGNDDRTHRIKPKGWKLQEEVKETEGKEGMMMREVKEEEKGEREMREDHPGLSVELLCNRRKKERKQLEDCKEEDGLEKNKTRTKNNCSFEVWRPKTVQKEPFSQPVGKEVFHGRGGGKVREKSFQKESFFF